MPVDEVVVGELGVVGDVLQVVEDLLAGCAYDDRHCHGVHGVRSLDVRKAAGRLVWSRRPGLAWLGRAGGETDGVAVLGVAHDLRGHRRLATESAAELADDSVGGGADGACVQVDVLACERGASTVGAAVAVGLERTDTAPQENALELLDMAGGGHGLKDSLPRARFLPKMLGASVRRVLPGARSALRLPRKRSPGYSDSANGTRGFATTGRRV